MLVLVWYWYHIVPFFSHIRPSPSHSGQQGHGVHRMIYSPTSPGVRILGYDLFFIHPHLRTFKLESGISLDMSTIGAACILDAEEPLGGCFLSAVWYCRYGLLNSKVSYTKRSLALVWSICRKPLQVAKAEKHRQACCRFHLQYEYTTDCHGSEAL